MITIGQTVKVSKGCNARGISKGITCKVSEVTPLGADYSYAVRVVLTALNGFQCGKSFVFFARHPNRLADAVVSLNDGRPEHKIQIVRK